MNNKEFKIHNDNCLEVLKEYPDNYFDAIVCDPPYGLSKQPKIEEVLNHWLNDKEYTHKSKGFMGKEWDSFVPSPFIWKECFRVLKEGGHLIAFAGTRTQDLMAISLRLGGFEVRDMGAWLYGSGFPKSHNISKAIDKKQGNEREVFGLKKHARDGDVSNQNWTKKNYTKESSYTNSSGNNLDTRSTSPDGIKWEGWGTALKPALEPFTIARKPFKGNVADNVLKNGTGAINIDACRIETNDKYEYKNGAGGNSFSVNQLPDGKRIEPVKSHEGGRFPANVLHDGSQPIIDMLDEKTKYFYCPKASKSDRNEGLDSFEDKIGGSMSGKKTREGKPTNQPIRKNHHPTVKPTELMAYLCRLITPKGGKILDPFCGSGSTGKAAIREGFTFVGVDLSEEYCEIAKARIEHELKKKG